MLKLDANPWKPVPTFRQPVSISQALDDLVFWVRITSGRTPDIEIRMPLDQHHRATAAIDNAIGSGYDLRRSQCESADGVFRYNGIRFLPLPLESVDPGEFAEGFALSGEKVTAACNAVGPDKTTDEKLDAVITLLAIIARA